MDFYSQNDYVYNEFAVCIEDSDTDVAKFFLPVVTPLLSSDEPYDKKDDRLSKMNILNKDDVNLNIYACTTSNYIELPLPHGETGCKKGDKYVVSFIGGDVNTPFLVGRYRR